jgi:hypothetical protein
MKFLIMQFSPTSYYSSKLEATIKRFEIILFRDEVTRHHYYLQLRSNVQTRGLLHANSTEEVLCFLAGYALQADLGDFVEGTHTGTYFKPEEYCPQQVSSKVYRKSGALEQGFECSEILSVFYIREREGGEKFWIIWHNSAL